MSHRERRLDEGSLRCTQAALHLLDHRNRILKGMGNSLSLILLANGELQDQFFGQCSRVIQAPL